MTPSDFIATARDLAGGTNSRRPRQTNLRRAVSTAYYALFHSLATCCADMLVGGSGSNRSGPAWRQTYRALQHNTARRRCSHATIKLFPNELQDFASRFADMQAKRERADYDPEGTFDKSVVLQDVDLAEMAISQFAKVPLKDRRAFAVYVLLSIRNN